MTVLFRPDTYLPRDEAGHGRWLRGHYDEHRQFITLGAALKPPLIIPDYDLLPWSAEPRFQRFWLDVHQQIHAIIDDRAGISSIDFSAVDLDKDGENFVWQSDHALAHAEERAFFGITG